MHCVAPHYLPPTPPEDYDDPLGLTRPIADLSLDLGSTSPTYWVPSFVPSPTLPSYDPMSPSYDTCAASPCNPFPTSSPFASTTFTRSTTSSRLAFEDSYASEAVESCAAPLPYQPQSQALSQATALSRIPPPHSAPYLRRTKPCRFYLDASGCKSGRWCNFKHPVGARSEDRSSNEDSTLDELRAAVVQSKVARSAINGDTSAWDDMPDVRDLNPNWGKKGEDDVHPKWRSAFGSLLCQLSPHLTLVQHNLVETFFLVYAAMGTSANLYTSQVCSRLPHQMLIPRPFLSHSLWTFH